MANKNKKQQQSAPAASQEKQLSRKEKYQNWVSSKLDRAAQDDFNVISQKTRDTSMFVNLLNSNDRLMYELRMAVDPTGSRVTMEVFADFMEKSKAAKEALNLINAQLAQLLHKKYTPPRGLKNPLEKKQPAQVVKLQEHKPAPVPQEKKEEQKVATA